MIINTTGNNITVPYNNICTYPLGSPGLYGIPNLVAKLNGSSIFYLPTGQYLVKGNAVNVTLPSIFTTSVISNIYQLWYIYYLYNDFGTASTYNAAFIDASGNVDLGYYNNTFTAGIQFASGVTNTYKQGVFGNNTVYNTTSGTDTTLLSISYYAQHVNPTVSLLAWITASGQTGGLYAVLDGVSATLQHITVTTHNIYTFSFSTNDTQLNLHTLAIHGYSVSGSANLNVQFLSCAS